MPINLMEYKSNREIFVMFFISLLCAATIAPVFAGDQHLMRLRGFHNKSQSAHYRQLEERVNVNHISHLYPSKEIPYHWFGEAVAVSEHVAIVGAPGTEDFSNYGVAYVYHRKESTQLQGQSWKWEEVAALEPPTKGVYASFGASVSIFEGCAFVGAPK